MPPKQATLGYVRSSQQTLGKFFGNSNGSKPAPQQSKLAFSTGNKTKEKASALVSERSKANGKLGKENKGDEDDKDVEMKDEEDEDEKNIPNSNGMMEPSSSARKRSIDETEDTNEDEDEPPVKRTRGKPTSSKPIKTEPQSTPALAKLTSPAKPQTVKVEEKEPEETDADEEEASSSVEAESEAEADAEEEEEKPAVTASKARKNVQATLSPDRKDPYPDWKAGSPVPYAALCTTFSKIEMTTKRLEIMSHCSLFLVQVLRLTPDDLLPTVLLMVNKLAADYAGIELGIGESLIMKAIGETTGKNLQFIKADQKEIGDLGLVAAKSRSTQRTMFTPKPLTVRGVHEGLMAIATTEGQGAQGRKVAGIKKLLSSADAHLLGKGSKGIDITKDKGGPSECKYIIRALEGKMRLGLAEKTILVSLAHAIVTHEAVKAGKKAPSADELLKGEQLLKAVFNELPSYEVVIPAMLEHGILHVRDTVKLQPGVPLKPMLARPTKSLTEVLDRFEGHDFSCEYKYDGERAQIHFVAHDSDQQYATPVPQAGKNAKGISNIFSRNSEDLSKKYPDILAKLPTWVKDTTKSFVLDCETVAWDVQAKHVLPFQQLMTRKRKDVKVEDVKVKVCVFAFDILFLNGEALVNKSFRERRTLLHSAFNEVEGEFAFAKYGNTNVVEEIQTLLEDSMKASCEGLMVKMLDGVESHYEPSRRSQNWLKVKKDYLAGAGDSLDLVVIGAYHGRGKRTSWFGAFLLACWNPLSETYETVCNIGTGFSEQVLTDLHTQLSPLAIDRPKPFYAHSTGNKDQPDVWLEPRFVWEVKTADLTLSPRYRAAADELPPNAAGKGVSLRFPRFLRIRDDKKPEDATTSEQIADMYRSQESVSKKGSARDDEFDY